jgi:hypothetical protein
MTAGHSAPLPTLEQWRELLGHEQLHLGLQASPPATAPCGWEAWLTTFLARLEAGVDPYVPAAWCRSATVGTHKALLCLLDRQPGIRRRHRGRQRLEVNARDFLAYLDGVGETVDPLDLPPALEAQLKAGEEARARRRAEIDARRRAEIDARKCR